MEENTGQERGRGIRRGNQTRENKLITLLRGSSRDPHREIILS